VKQWESRYNREDGTYLIEIELSHARQLFNSLDPSPFIEKDLDDDAEAYIVDSVREFALNVPQKLVFYVPASEQAELADTLADAVHNHFQYKANVARKELRFIMRQGRFALVVGSLFLVFCLSTREAVESLQASFWSRLLSEGLLITGWVAMWRPVEIILYTWWPSLRMRQVYEKLMKMDIEVRTRTLPRV
jgi:hypothetical protein